MGYKIITISREFGSGGNTIGKEVAKKLGIPCYDQQIIERLEAESGFSKEYIADKSEYANHANWFSNMVASGNSLHATSNQDYLWGLQKNIVQELAKSGPCVIIGRCADYLLKKDFNCLRVFIHSSLENRSKRILEEHGDAHASHHKRLRIKDKKRKAYYKYYTGTEWGVAKNYHISLDSGSLGVDKCVDIIVALYNHE